MKHTLHTPHILLFIMLFVSMSVLSGATYAQQSDNKVQSLGDILNPKIGDYKENLSVDERGNIYFSKCMATESLAFDVEEKELLCACTSAKLGDIITGPEFVSLYKDTKKGETARLKVITYAYTKCIDYAIREKIYKDCRVLPVLKSIKYGKKNICECTANHYERLLTNGAAHLIMEGIKYAPMTLNPMERYFTTNAYYNTLSKYAKACRSQMLYDRHN